MKQAKRISLLLFFALWLAAPAAIPLVAQNINKTVTLSLNDSTLNSIAGARIEQDEASMSTVRVIPLGNGEFAFGYPDGRIPAAVRSGARKSTIVKLKVWLQGNKSGKPNATVSVSVKFA